MKLSCAAFLLATPAHAGILNMFRNEEQKLATTGDVAFGHSRRLKAQPDTALVDTDKAVPNQVFYIPLPENDVYYDALKKIQPGRDQNGKLHVSGKMVSLVSVAISTDQTVIWYDHWEDGYEGDATHAISTNTNIWGDGIASNGCRPDIAMVKTCTDEDDVLNAGDSFVIESKVPVPRTSSNWFESGLKLDGGDKMMSSYPITVTRGEYAENPGSLLAGAVEVYDTTVWGTEFDAPVGQDFGTTTEAFQYSRFFIMSGSNGNKVTLPDGSTPTLNEGQTINFSVNMGDKVTSEEPLQVYLLTGDPGSTYEMRWFSIMPTSRWSDSYLAAVGDDFARTKALMFNPGSAPITVKLTYLDDKGAETSENISLPSKKSKYTRIIPTGSGGKIESKGNVFYALSVTDTEMYTDKNNGGTEKLYGQAFDWGYPLQPINMLTSQVLIGWGYGCTSNDCQGKTERSAVWVSPMDDIDLYVDYQNTGSGYDVMEVAKYQSVMVRDTSDHDMSGAILFATAKGSGPDGTPVDFASAWGQDPAVSRDTQSISLDLGTAVLPFPTVRTSKVVDKTTAAPGDILTYTITVQNVGQSGILAGKYKIVDPLPPMTTFVESYGIKYSSNGGTSFSSLDLSGIDVGSTAFPLDEGGLPSQAALPRRGGVHQLKFQVLVDPELVDGSVVTNSGYIDAPFGGNVKFEASTKLVYAPDITISNVVYLGDKGALGCDGASENVTDVTGSGVTYCFAITNVGSTYLDSVVVENDDLGIVAGDLTVPKLAPGGSKLVTFKSSITSELVNMVTVKANPVYNNGADIEGVPDVAAQDPSGVMMIENLPDIVLENTVYSGHGSPDACEAKGVELVRGYEDDKVTYCFKVTNTGNTLLTNIELTDTDIAYTNKDLIDLAPGASTVVSTHRKITATLENTATVSGTPSKANKQPIPGMADVTSTDPSEVIKVIDADTRSGDKVRPETCMQTNWEDAGNKQNLVCRAKEVYHVNWVDPPSLSCTEGETIKLSLFANIHYNTARYDSGWYVAQDGGDALEGLCTVGGLTSGGFDYQPQATKKNSKATIAWNKDAKGGNDECGDVLIDGGGGADLVVPFIEEKEIKCVDDNYDGLLDFGACFSWRVKGLDDFCTLSRSADGTQGLEADLYPANPAKCFCSRLDVPTITVVKPSDDISTSPC